VDRFAEPDLIACFLKMGLQSKMALSTASGYGQIYRKKTIRPIDVKPKSNRWAASW